MNSREDSLLLSSLNSEIKIFDLRMNQIRETIDTELNLTQSCQKTKLAFDNV